MAAIVVSGAYSPDPAAVAAAVAVAALAAVWHAIPGVRSSTVAILVIATAAVILAPPTVHLVTRHRLWLRCECWPLLDVRERLLKRPRGLCNTQQAGGQGHQRVKCDNLCRFAEVSTEGRGDLKPSACVQI